MRSLTPFPGPAFSKQVEFALSQTFGMSFSGEFKADVDNKPIGAVKTAGKVANVFLSVEKSGKDDTNPLQVSGEVFINSVSCLTTKPSIAHVSGEASQQKTTIVTGDTGIAQAAMDTDNNSYVPGDVLTATLTLERTGSPTTEILNPVIVVELEPESP
jgi:hypothetical protein